jgi:hypothetical protein
LPAPRHRRPHPARRRSRSCPRRNASCAKLKVARAHLGTRLCGPRFPGAGAQIHYGGRAPLDLRRHLARTRPKRCRGGISSPAADPARRIQLID